MFHNWKMHLEPIGLLIQELLTGDDFTKEIFHAGLFAEGIFNDAVNRGAIAGFHGAAGGVSK